MREHNDAVSRIDFITSKCEITTAYAPGEVVEVQGTTAARCGCANCIRTTTRPTGSPRMTYMHKQARAKSSLVCCMSDPLRLITHGTQHER